MRMLPKADVDFRKIRERAKGGSLYVPDDSIAVVGCPCCSDGEVGRVHSGVTEYVVWSKTEMDNLPEACFQVCSNHAALYVERETFFTCVPLAEFRRHACHYRVRESWCDRNGLRDFMGHACFPLTTFEERMVGQVAPSKDIAPEPGLRSPRGDIF